MKIDGIATEGIYKIYKEHSTIHFSFRLLTVIELGYLIDYPFAQLIITLFSHIEY